METVYAPCRGCELPTLFDAWADPREHWCMKCNDAATIAQTAIDRGIGRRAFALWQQDKGTSV